MAWAPGGATVPEKSEKSVVSKRGHVRNVSRTQAGLKGEQEAKNHKNLDA